MSGFAIYYENEAFGVKESAAKGIMGRQAAGATFLRAIANSDYEKLWCYTRSRAEADICARQFVEFGGGAMKFDWIDFMHVAKLEQAGLLFRPDPGVYQEGWRRLCYSTPRAYSVCGITHTTATTNVMTVIAGLLTAPLEEWDAVICTSSAVRASLKGIIEAEADYLRERIGASRFTLPQLPVIPLGIHCADYAFDEARRQDGRRALHITADEIVYLFVGRLSFVEKAHPFAMYLGLEACATALPDKKITLVLAGWFASPEVEKIFKDEAAKLCPSVRSIFVDGNDPIERAHAWAAADVFTSLSDNIQETFGLTPVEAMAASLPVVVSDWNGYKETVRDGHDGYRIPTLTMAPGTGQGVSDRLDMNVLNYQAYCGFVAQYTAVNVCATADAYIRLAQDAGLRKTLGASGRLHAERTFDWPVVFRRYQELFAELAERRRTGAALQPQLKRRRRADRPDPFTMFANYATGIIGAKVQFRRMPNAADDALALRRSTGSLSFATTALPQAELLQELLDLFPDAEWHSLEQLQKLRPQGRPHIEGMLVWLAKAGLLEFRHPGSSA